MVKSLRRVRNKPGCCPFCSAPLADDGSITFNRETGFISRWGSSLYLTPQHATLVDVLLRAWPQPVPRERLEIAAWGYDVQPHEKALHVSLSQIRSCLRIMGINILHHSMSGYYLIKDPGPPEGHLKMTFSTHEVSASPSARKILKAVSK